MSSVASKTVPLTCHGHSRPITHLSFSPVLENEHYYLISSCKDNNPMFRDGKTGDWIGTFLGHKGAVWQGRLSSDASYAATGSADFTAKLWDTNTGECLDTFQHNHMVRAVALSPGAIPERLGTGGPEKKLRIYDLRRGAFNANEPVAAQPSLASSPALEFGAGVHEGAIKAVLWTSNANVVISAAEDKAVRWWDVRTSNPIATCMLDGPLGSCEITDTSSTSSQHSTLAIAAGKKAYFFAGSTPGQLIKSVTTPHEIAAVAVDRPDNKFVTGGGADTWVRVYSFDDEEELSLLKGHHGPVWTASFAPDNKLFATGSEDGTIKLWKFTSQTYGLWK